MTGMIERMAKALYHNQWLDGVNHPAWEHAEGGGQERDFWLNQARIALAAMREPTEAMLEAPVAREQDARDVWKHMIDAALKEAP